jgi:ribonuclease H / adenosylcobalamin/alpha-ribazole phosphatase
VSGKQDLRSPISEADRPRGSTFLVRHAPTSSNFGKVFMGQLDVPALPVEHPERFRVPGTGPRKIYASPLGRARTTAALLFPGETAFIDDRLAERSVGAWEGLDHATVKARWPSAFADGKVDPLAEPPGGETLNQLTRRVRDFLAMLVSRQDERDVYVVTHNGWIRLALHLNGEVALEQLFAEPVPFLRPISFELTQETLRRRASP